MREERKELLYLVGGGIIGALAAYVFMKGKYKLDDLAKEISYIIKDYKKANERIAEALDRLEKLNNYNKKS